MAGQVVRLSFSWDTPVKYTNDGANGGCVAGYGAAELTPNPSGPWPLGGFLCSLVVGTIPASYSIPLRRPWPAQKQQMFGGSIDEDTFVMCVNFGDHVQQVVCEVSCRGSSS